MVTALGSQIGEGESGTSCAAVRNAVGAALDAIGAVRGFPEEGLEMFADDGVEDGEEAGMRLMLSVARAGGFHVLVVSRS